MRARRRQGSSRRRRRARSAPGCAARPARRRPCLTTSDWPCPAAAERLVSPGGHQRTPGACSRPCHACACLHAPCSMASSSCAAQVCCKASFACSARCVLQHAHAATAARLAGQARLPCARRAAERAASHFPRRRGAARLLCERPADGLLALAAAPLQGHLAVALQLLQVRGAEALLDACRIRVRVFIWQHLCLGLQRTS
jgi:hypothetical protein